MSNDVIRFSARFGGVSHAVSVPVSAVLAIYARETGQGMALPEDTLADAADEADAEVEVEVEAEDSATTTTTLSVVSDEGAPGDGDDPHPPTPRRSGHLRIVK
jgi:stringent starvation protein B